MIFCLIHSDYAFTDGMYCSGSDGVPWWWLRVLQGDVTVDYRIQWSPLVVELQHYTD